MSFRSGHLDKQGDIVCLRKTALCVWPQDAMLPHLSHVLAILCTIAEPASTQ